MNDDLWARDTGPSFLVNPHGQLAGSTWNFNGWGNKQVHANDAKLAGEILQRLGVPNLSRRLSPKVERSKWMATER